MMYLNYIIYTYVIDYKYNRVNNIIHFSNGIYNQRCISANIESTYVLFIHLYFRPGKISTDTNAVYNIEMVN